jgi:hypothetical protein
MRPTRQSIIDNGWKLAVEEAAPKPVTFAPLEARTVTNDTAVEYATGFEILEDETPATAKKRGRPRKTHTEDADRS